MHLFFRLIENELFIKFQQKKKKKKIRVVIPVRIYQSFFKLINFFFRIFKIIYYLFFNFIIRIIINRFLRKIKTRQRIINCIVIISRNVVKSTMIFYTFIILSIINKLFIIFPFFTHNTHIIGNITLFLCFR